MEAFRGAEKCELNLRILFCQNVNRTALYVKEKEKNSFNSKVSNDCT